MSSMRRLRSPVSTCTARRVSSCSASSTLPSVADEATRDAALLGVDDGHSRTVAVDIDVEVTVEVGDVEQGLEEVSRDLALALELTNAAASARPAGSLPGHHLAAGVEVRSRGRASRARATPPLRRSGVGAAVSADVGGTRDWSAASRRSWRSCSFGHKFPQLWITDDARLCVTSGWASGGTSHANAMPPIGGSRSLGCRSFADDGFYGFCFFAGSEAPHGPVPARARACRSTGCAAGAGLGRHDVLGALLALAAAGADRTSARPSGSAGRLEAGHRDVLRLAPRLSCAHSMAARPRSPARACCG